MTVKDSRVQCDHFGSTQEGFFHPPKPAPGWRNPAMDHRWPVRHNSMRQRLNHGHRGAPKQEQEAGSQKEQQQYAEKEAERFKSRRRRRAQIGRRLLLIQRPRHLWRNHPVEAAGLGCGVGVTPCGEWLSVSVTQQIRPVQQICGRLEPVASARFTAD